MTSPIITDFGKEKEVRNLFFEERVTDFGSEERNLLESALLQGVIRPFSSKADAFVDEFTIVLKSLFEYLAKTRDADMQQAAIKKYSISDFSSSPRTQVIKQFDTRARFQFCERTEIAFEVIMELLLKFLAIPAEKKKVRMASIGSGTGIYETYVASLFQRLCSGVDFSLHCIEPAEGMRAVHSELLQLMDSGLPSLPPICLDNIHLLSGLMTDLPYEDNAFSIIFNNYVLPWEIAWKVAVKEMSRVLDENGFVYLFIPAHNLEIERGFQDIPLAEFVIGELLTELEVNNLTLKYLRYISAKTFYPRIGNVVVSNMIFVLAQKESSLVKLSWQERLRNSGGKPIKHWDDMI